MRFGKIIRRSLGIVLSGALLVSTSLGSNALFFVSGIETTSLAYIGETPSDEVKVVDKIEDGTLQNYLFDVAKDAGYTGSLSDLTTQALKDYVNLEGKGNLVIPSGVNNIKGLGYIRSIKTLDISACSNIKEIDANEFNQCKEMTFVKLPSSVTTINEGAFQSCEKLETINLENVTTIEGNAFSGCKSLSDESIATMRDSLTEVGNSAFHGCESLTTAKIPVISNDKHSKSVPASLFANCNSLCKVIFCDPQISVIQMSAFANTGNLTFKGASDTEYGSRLPDSISEIEESAFFGSRISDVDMSGTKLTEIRPNVFERADVSGSIKLPGTLKKIGEKAFSLSKIQEIIMPGSVTELGRECFYRASALGNVVLSSAIEIIPEAAFQKVEQGQVGSVDSLLTVSFSGSDNNIKEIKATAFNTSALFDNDFIFGLKKLETIGEGAFSFNYFSSIKIPANVKELGKDVFVGNSLVNEIVFEKGSNVTELPENCFGYPVEKITVDGKEVYYVPETLEKVVLPDKIEKIGKNCFSFAGYNFGEPGVLDTVGFGDRVEEGKVIFPDTLKEFGISSFAYCTGFKTLFIPEGITELPEKAFYQCGAYPREEENQKAEIRDEKRLKELFSSS